MGKYSVEVTPQASEQMREIDDKTVRVTAAVYQKREQRRQLEQMGRR